MSTMTETQNQTYEGWANYPTWNVNLWLSNDQALYQRTLDAIAGADEYYNDGDGEGQYGPWGVFLADWLRDFCLEDLLEDAFDADRKGNTGMADDLTQWALGRVNWLEIADAWIEVAKNES